MSVSLAVISEGIARIKIIKNDEFTERRGGIKTTSLDGQDVRIFGSFDGFALVNRDSALVKRRRFTGSVDDEFVSAAVSLPVDNAAFRPNLR